MRNIYLFQTYNEDLEFIDLLIVADSFDEAYTHLMEEAESDLCIDVDNPPDIWKQENLIKVDDTYDLDNKVSDTRGVCYHVSVLESGALSSGFLLRR